jgi:HEAT repeat protein
MGAKAAAAVPQLMKALNDGEVTVRLVAAQALGAIGPQASAAVPGLVAQIQDPNQGRLVFRTAMLALGQIGPGAKEALPVLREIAAKRPDTAAGDIVLMIEGKGDEVRTYY